MIKTIFITGASAGVGKATAKLFAAKGWNVIATMRTPEKETELNQIENITLIQLDVTNLNQIKDVTQQALALGHIDVVFNNAGYGLMGPLEAFTDEQIQHQLNTNLLGVIRVTQACIPYFRARKNGLFITTSSLGGLLTYPLCSIYHASKWAIEGWSESMAFELNQFGIRIKTVLPGSIKTDFLGRSMDLVSHPEYEKLIGKLVNGFMTNPERYKGFSEAIEIAEVVYEAATDGTDKLRYIAGSAAKSAYARRLEIGDEVFRKGVEQTWLVSE